MLKCIEKINKTKWGDDTNKDIYKTIKKAKKKLLKVTLKYEGPIEAPIKKDDFVGKFRVVYDDELEDRP